MSRIKRIVILLSLVNLCYSADEVFDVTKYGADSKGVSKSTDAIKKAIEAASAKGGGVVQFPKGKYLTGPIHLKSNIALEFEEGSDVNFSTDFNDYLPMVLMRWEGTVVNNFSPLIYGYEVENIAIRGKGVLEGNGKVWWDKWHALYAEYNANKTRPETYQNEFVKNNNLTLLAQGTMNMARINPGFLRPPFIQPYKSKNIHIEGITLKNSPFWNINPVFSQNITIKDVRIEAPYGPGINTDGIDPDSCKDVLITGVYIDVGDDCIAIKSGMDGQGRQYNVPSENIVIENSHIMKGCAGVAIGSDTAAGAHNVTVRNTVFNGTDEALSIKSTRGRGGIVENVVFKNITITKIKHQALRLYLNYHANPGDKENNTPEPFSERTPVARHIVFQDISGDANKSAEMLGLQESNIEDIEITNVHIKFEHGYTQNFTKDLKITSSEI